jgi:hypothetical protein
MAAQEWRILVVSPLRPGIIIWDNWSLPEGYVAYRRRLCRRSAEGGLT